MTMSKQKSFVGLAIPIKEWLYVHNSLRNHANLVLDHQRQIPQKGRGSKNISKCLFFKVYYWFHDMQVKFKVIPEKR